MDTLIKNAVICDTESMTLRKGETAFCDGIIVDSRDSNAECVIDAEGAFVIPGFVDVHTHGRAGYDFCSSDEEGMRIAAKSYLATGTTTVMPTLASAPYDGLLTAADRINSVRADTGGARFAGIHLEGRYLNPDFCGAHRKELLAPFSIRELEELVFRMCLPCHITAALELDGGKEFAKEAKTLGATLGLGHTGATFEEAFDIYKKYGISFTHLFNAMPQIHHRSGGAAVAGLESGAFCELICDGMHISDEMVKLAYTCLSPERLVLITDSMEAAGCPDGDYMIAGSPCKVKEGKALTAEGKLAGSTLDMKTAVENLMRFCGIGLAEAVRCATLNPAREVGIDNTVGSLSPGKFADALIVRENGGKLTVEKIFIGGRQV